jgi:Zn-dependent protease with chaperone function
MPGAILIAALLLVVESGVQNGQNAEQSVPVIVEPPSALAVQYYRSETWLWLLSEAVSLGIPAGLLVTGSSARMRDTARYLGRVWFFSVAVYAVLFFAATAILRLPLSYYLGYVRPHAYGLSDQSVERWFQQWLISTGVSIATRAALLWIPYLLLCRSPKRWWLYCGLLVLPFLVFAAMIKPVWFDPLLNRFGPMHNQQLERKILDLADRAGIAGGRVYEVDKSKDTKTVNAYVTGMFGTKRIVLWDTMFQKLTDDEVLVVMGHEMGHYVLGHVARGTFVAFVLTLVGLWFVDRSGRWTIRRRGERFGIADLSDVASVPLLLLLGQVYALAAVPVGNAYSRYQEHEADRFALEITQANHSAGMAFVKFQRENLSHPRPDWYVKLWRGSHPSLGDRIDFANAYHPWRTGEPLRYGTLFRARSATRLEGAGHGAGDG